MGEHTSTSHPRNQSRHGHAIIVVGGHPPDRRVLGALPESACVICADSGLDHAMRLGLVPAIVIGDMDSVDPANLRTARVGDCKILEHPPEKDFTDTELALEHAVGSGFGRVTLLWGGGDRIDHVLGVFAALGHPSLAELTSLDAWIAADHVDIVHAGRELVVDHERNTTISLLAIGSKDAVVTTRGLKWDLQDELLSGERARGLSNRIESSPCSILCTQGVTAVVAPDLLTSTERTPRS